MAGWVEVAPEVAAAHPLHGMRGWLRFFSLWIALAAMGGVALGYGDIQALVETPGADAALEAGVNLATSAVQLVVAVLWFRAWRHFRLAFLGLTVLATLVAMGFDLAAWREEGALQALADQVASDVVGTAALLVLLGYMWRSRRFRVTFENRVRGDDPLLSR